MRRVWRGTRRWVRGVVALVVVALVAAGAWWVWWREPAAAQEATATTPTVAASLTTMEKSVSGSGTLTPGVQEDVSFEVSGTVQSVDVAVGDEVTAGQTLATVDTLTLDADLLSAEADLAEAEARLDDAEDADDGSDAADAQVEAAQAQVDVAQAQVDDAQEAMGDATLVSPVDGVLTTVGLEVGDVVGSSSPTGGDGGATTTAQFVVTGTETWSVEVPVGEADVALLAVGNQVEMTSDDLTGTVYGVVTTIGLVSTSTSGVAQFPVEVEVTSAEDTLHDGISVDATIIYQRRTDVLSVPALAVTSTDDGGSQVTRVAADGTQETVVVETGERSGNQVEITSGLAEGDEVVIALVSRGTQGGTGTDGQFFGPPDGELPQFDGQLPDGGFQGGQAPDGTNG